jgi:hypothetical protein
VNGKSSFKQSGSVSCFSATSSRNGKSNENDGITMEGELMKLGRKTERWINRWYVLRDSALLCYKDHGSKAPDSKVICCLIVLDVIYLNGLYIEPYFTKGIKGMRIFHDSDYFKERTFYHKD